jgi:hypothetical protein
MQIGHRSDAYANRLFICRLSLERLPSGVADTRTFTRLALAARSQRKPDYFSVANAREPLTFTKNNKMPKLESQFFNREFE